MAKRSVSSFKSTKNTRFADSTTGEISAGDSRDMYEDVADSFLNITDHLLDEDDMSSDSATKVPSQQSVKAYVDAQVSDAGGTSGTYTPTLSNTSNIASSSVVANRFTYIQVGDIVSVKGAVNIDPTSAATMTLHISLPVASANLATLSGMGIEWSLYNVGGIIPDTIGHTASLGAIARVDTAQVWYVSFQYKVQ